MSKQIHYQNDVLERFIPVSLEKLIKDLISLPSLESEQASALQKFCETYTTLFHAQSYQQRESLKQLYQTYNPDRDVLISEQADNPESLQNFKTDLYHILEQANYEKISRQDLDDALNKISPHGVKVSVDFDDFSEVALFYRGAAINTVLHSNWWTLGFKKHPLDILIYRRLFILLQPKSKQQWLEYFTEIKKLPAKKALAAANKALENAEFSHDSPVVYLKLFKDIPRSDLEMQFPNTRIQIRLFDKIKLAVMGSGGTAGGVMATLGKLSAAVLDPMTALMAIGGLLGVIWRQIAKVFSQRAKYSAALTKNLYFYNLDNNMGVLTHLMESAAAEECKEAILAYYFLLLDGTSSRTDLDKRIEAYIQQQYNLPMDFEIDDGLAKLQKSQLLSRCDSMITAVPLQDALLQLKQQWLQLMGHKLTT